MAFNFEWEAALHFWTHWTIDEWKIIKSVWFTAVILPDLIQQILEYSSSGEGVGWRKDGGRGDYANKENLLSFSSFSQFSVLTQGIAKALFFYH